MADDSSFSTRIRKLVKYYFGVSNALSFTFASTFGRAVADHACLGFISVLIEQQTKSIMTAALITTIFECVSRFLDSFFARPSYRLMPYPITNLITEASFVTGILMLSFTAPDSAADSAPDSAPNSAPDWSSGIFYLALVLFAVGSAGYMLTSRFLFHYISLGDDIIDVKNVLDRIYVWRSPARFMGSIVGLSISKSGWKPIFKILSILTIIGYVFLICGISYYKCQENERNAGETSNRSQDQINQSSQKGSLITQARRLPKLLLLYTPFLIYYVVQGAGNTLFYDQVGELEDHIKKILFFGAASSLFTIQKGTSFMTKLLMKILTVTKLWKESEQWQCAKLILGMFVCFCCCMCSWYVESQRLDSKQTMNKYLWMVPQFALLGIAKELVEDGMHDVFFSHLKISMHLWASSFICFVQGLGNALGAVFIVVLGKWISDDIKKSRLDKYYFLLAVLTILAMLFFMCLWTFYAPKIKPEKDDKEGTELRQSEEGTNFSRSHYPHPTESPAESTSKSSSNIDSSVVKRSLSYLDQPSNPAENVLYQRSLTRPKTNYEGITHQSSALSNLRPHLAAKSIHERSDGCSEMN